MGTYRILTVNNPKTQKGEGRGYLTALLHLAPFNLSGRNVCQYATAGCAAACLNTAGRGGMGAGSLEDIRRGNTNMIQKARIRRTDLLFNDPDTFYAQLVADIRALERSAARHGLTPVVRLNGTSDMPWERMKMPNGLTVFAAFPHIQFYDYTKRPDRNNLPANYHLTFSLADGNEDHAVAAMARGMNVAAVFPSKVLPASYMGRNVVNGDVSDLRFLDPRGVVVGLSAKGRAKRDASGFVRRDLPILSAA